MCLEHIFTDQRVIDSFLRALAQTTDGWYLTWKVFTKRWDRLYSVFYNESDGFDEEQEYTANDTDIDLYPTVKDENGHTVYYASGFHSFAYEQDARRFADDMCTPSYSIQQVLVFGVKAVGIQQGLLTLVTEKFKIQKCNDAYYRKLSF